MHSLKEGASAEFAAATGLTKTRGRVCVSNVRESMIKQPVTAVALLSHSAVDRHRQAHTSTHTHTHWDTHMPRAVARSYSQNSSHLALLIWAQCGVVMHLCEHLSALKPSSPQYTNTQTPAATLHAHSTFSLLYHFFLVWLFSFTCLNFVGGGGST